MSITNRLTGEAVVDGTDAHVLFTLDSLAYIEAQTSKRIMEFWSEASAGKVGVSDLVILLTAGMEGHRRRHGGAGGQVNPAKAAKVIDAGGGLRKVYPQVFESLTRSQSLGLTDNEDSEEDEGSADPTNGGSFSSDSPAQEFPRVVGGP